MSKYITFTTSGLTTIQKRISELPKYYIGHVDAKLKKTCDLIVKEYKKGIRENAFGLHPLKPQTISQKRRMGYTKPDTPLYGKGDQDARSYINSLYLHKIKNGWKILISRKMHHKAKLTLRQLFYVHEYGAIISGKGGALIRIMPRPAFLRATEKVQKISGDKGINLSLAHYVNTGNDTQIVRATKNFNEGMEKYFET